MRYVDFDSPELEDYPEVYRRVTKDRDLEPGMLLIGGELVSIWDVPYPRLVREFEKMGLQRLRKAS